jgi:hypothetical protein
VDQRQKPERARREARGRGGLGALIMTLQITDGPEYWRQRAEEARAVAVQMADAHTKGDNARYCATLR